MMLNIVYTHVLLFKVGTTETTTISFSISWSKANWVPV